MVFANRGLFNLDVCGILLTKRKLVVSDGYFDRVAERGNLAYIDLSASRDAHIHDSSFQRAGAVYFLTVTVEPILASFKVIETPPKIKNNQTIILFAIALLMAMRVPLTLTIKFPFRLVTTSTSAPSTNPRLSR